MSEWKYHIGDTIIFHLLDGDVKMSILGIQYDREIILNHSNAFTHPLAKLYDVDIQWDEQGKPKHLRDTVNEWWLSRAVKESRVDVEHNGGNKMKYNIGGEVMEFWGYNVGDKLIFNPDKCEDDTEREYYVVDRFVDGAVEGFVSSYPNARRMYTVWGVRHHGLQTIEEADLTGRLMQDNGDIERDVLGTAKWTLNAKSVHKINAVDHPSYYQGKIEVIDFIEDKKLGFNLGNCVKYISRAGKKNPDKRIEDLKKARWYLDREINKEK